MKELVRSRLFMDAKAVIIDARLSYALRCIILCAPPFSTLVIRMCVLTECVVVREGTIRKVAYTTVRVKGGKLTGITAEEVAHFDLTN